MRRRSMDAEEARALSDFERENASTVNKRGAARSDQQFMLLFATNAERADTDLATMTAVSGARTADIEHHA